MEKYENLNNVIADNLIYYRKKANLTQQELAAKLSYSDKSISKWERGEGVPDIHVLVVLAKLYGLSVNDFVSTNKKQKIANFYLPKFMIMLMAIILSWLVVVIIFFAFKIFGHGNFRPWLVFIYGIPLSCLVWTIFNDVFFNKLLNIPSVSLMAWGIALSIYLSFPDIKNLYLIFIVCIPIEILIILFYIFIYKKEKNKEK